MENIKLLMLLNTLTLRHGLVSFKQKLVLEAIMGMYIMAQPHHEILGKPEMLVRLVCSSHLSVYIFGDELPKRYASRNTPQCMAVHYCEIAPASISSSDISCSIWPNTAKRTILEHRVNPADSRSVYEEIIVIMTGDLVDCQSMFVLTAGRTGRKGHT